MGWYDYPQDAKTIRGVGFVPDPDMVPVAVQLVSAHARLRFISVVSMALIGCVIGGVNLDKLADAETILYSNPGYLVGHAAAVVLVCLYGCVSSRAIVNDNATHLFGLALCEGVGVLVVLGLFIQAVGSMMVFFSEQFATNDCDVQGNRCSLHLVMLLVNVFLLVLDLACAGFLAIGSLAAYQGSCHLGEGRSFVTKVTIKVAWEVEEAHPQPGASWKVGNTS